MVIDALQRWHWNRGRARGARAARTICNTSCTSDSARSHCRAGSHAHASEALGQHMLKDQPEEVLARKCSPSSPPGATVRVREGHLSVSVRDDAALADHPAIEVAREVFQCGFAFADMPAVDDPGIRDARGNGQPGAIDPVEEASPEHLGEGPIVEQIASPLAAPVPQCPVETATRDDHMAVGMEVEIPGMGVEHQCQADLAAETAGIEPEVSQRARGSGTKHAVDSLLVPPGQATGWAG